MHIAIDCRMSGKSGIGSYFDALLPYFLKNYECLLIGNKETLQNITQNKNTSLCYCDEEAFSFKELLFFPKKILDKINQCDAYYSPYCNIPSGIKIPIYTTIHDVVFLDIKGLSSKVGTFIRKCFYQHAINKSKKIFTVSEFSSTRIKSNLHCKKDVVVTYNAAPEYYLEKNNVTFDNTEKQTPKENTILFVGNIKKHKGLSILLEAFSGILEELPTLKLIIVGSSENFRTGDSEIFDIIQTFPKDSVVFTGKISNDELRNYYVNAKLLVQPSFYEGFGMPPLEALNCKTNVVLSDIPVFCEIYKDFPVTFFKTGNSSDLKEKIKYALNLPEPNNIPNKYSFEKTFKIIKENIL